MKSKLKKVMKDRLKMTKDEHNQSDKNSQKVCKWFRWVRYQQSLVWRIGEAGQFKECMQLVFKYS